MKRILWILLLFLSCQANSQLKEYSLVIEEKGTDPIGYVSNHLKINDLIIFDDALHNAYEPFQFYQELLRSETTINYVFVEVFGINAQPYIDEFLSNPQKDSTILYPVFQDNFGGLGWNYATYYELLSTIWNLRNKEGRSLELIAVDQPIFWKGINSSNEYLIFRESLAGRDYFMYKKILTEMEGFKGDKKAIFLTNTRHAYKNITRSNGQPYWNCGTFFYRWHPAKTHSIRLHNVTLSIQALRVPEGNGSIEGMDRIEYSWEQMDNGLWDLAFEKNGNQPVAIPLNNNVFGNTKYMGNHMLDCAPNQLMSDAYDAIIFLAPLENLHSSAKMNFFYTSKFKEELKRRIEIIEGPNLSDMLKENNFNSIESYIEELSKPTPITLSNMLRK